MTSSNTNKSSSNVPVEPAGEAKGGYDEFAYFAENAVEHGLAYDGPPIVRREAISTDDGRTISSLVWGESEPELVLIHGGAQNAHTWDTVCLALGRPLVAIDMPGHGHSGPPADGAANVDRNADDIATAIEQLAPQARAVVGMSLGGLTTLAMSVANPSLFEIMVLVDITPGVNKEKADHIRRFVDGPGTFASFEELLERTMAFNPTRTESSLRRGILHNAKQLEDRSWVWRHARHRVFADTATDDTADGERDYLRLWDALETHDGPVALARGMRDQSVVTDDDVAEFLRRRPDARIENFPDAGHSIQGDMPVELAALISEFVAQSSAG